MHGLLGRRGEEEIDSIGSPSYVETVQDQCGELVDRTKSTCRYRN